MPLASFLQVWFVEGSFVGETFTCGERFLDWIGSHLPRLQHCHYTSSNMRTLHNVAWCGCSFRLHHAAPRCTEDCVFANSPRRGQDRAGGSRPGHRNTSQLQAAAFPASARRSGAMILKTTIYCIHCPFIIIYSYIYIHVCVCANTLHLYIIFVYIYIIHCTCVIMTLFV